MYKCIDNVVIGLLETYSTNDVYDICDCLKIQILRLEPSNLLLRGNDSIYHRDFNNQEMIFIRNDLTHSSEKFTLAHELGHAIIHPDIFQSSYNKSLINIAKLENQSNYFALKLLNIELDEIELCEMTIEQIASSLELPVMALKQLV